MASPARMPQRYVVCSQVRSAQTLRVLRAITTCSATGFEVGTPDVVAETGWPRAEVLHVLRSLRIRGLVTGNIWDRDTLELHNLSLTWGAHALVRSLTPRA